MTTAKKLQFALALLLILVGAVGGGYLTGRSHGRAEGVPALDEATTALTACENTVTNRGQALDETHREISLLESRRRVARAGDELDARNFGLAETELRAAVVALEQTVSAHPEAADLAGRMSATNVSVAADLDQQRSQLRSFATELDAFIAANAADTP